MHIKIISAFSLTVLALLSAACGNSANPTSAGTANTTANTAANTIVTKSAPGSGTNVNSAQTENNSNQPVTETSERKQILDALRIPISQELKQDIIFKVDHYKAEGGWAFVSASPKNKDGGAPNWKITKYQEYIDSGDFEDNLYALLKKTGDKWTVVTSQMNCHDVCYLAWVQDYKAPPSLFK